MPDNNCVIQSATSGLKPIMIRRRTDVFFILLVPLNFLLWLGIAIYEILNDPHRKLPVTHVSPSNYYLDLILLRGLANISIYAIVSVLVMLSFLFVTTVLKARWIVFAAISSIVITIVSFIVLIPWQLIILIFNSAKSYSLVFIIVGLMLTFLYLIYQVTIFVCTKETNINLTAELISKSCPAILHSFPAVLVSVAIAFLSIIVLMITINITLSKMFDYFPWNNNYPATSLDILRLSILFIGGMHIFNFIWNIGFAVMTDYFARSYARSENDKLQSAYVFQSASRVAKYNLGTVAFLSTPILPSLCALTMAFKSNRDCSTKSSYASINFFSKLSLIIDISDYALIETSINGYAALKSISEMLELHQRSSLLFLILNAMSTKIIEICIAMATIIGMIIRLWSLPMYQDIPFSRNLTHSKLHISDDMMALYQVFIAAIYMNYICKSVTRSAMSTFSIYQMNCIRVTESMDNHIAIAEQSI